MAITCIQALTFSALLCCAPLVVASTQTDISLIDRAWMKDQQRVLENIKSKAGAASVGLPALPAAQQDLISRLQDNIAAQQAPQDGKGTFPAIYFVSLGIPREGLLPMLSDARRFSIPPTLRGLLNNDVRQTAEAMFDISKEDDKAGIQIDPTLFSEYNIKTVPALVVTCPGHFDVIRGSLPLQKALEKVVESGDCAATAQRILKEAGE